MSPNTYLSATRERPLPSFPKNVWARRAGREAGRGRRSRCSAAIRRCTWRGSSDGKALSCSLFPPFLWNQNICLDGRARAREEMTCCSFVAGGKAMMLAEATAAAEALQSGVYVTSPTASQAVTTQIEQSAARERTPSPRVRGFTTAAGDVAEVCGILHERERERDHCPLTWTVLGGPDRGAVPFRPRGRRRDLRARALERNILRSEHVASSFAKKTRVQVGLSARRRAAVLSSRASRRGGVTLQKFRNS